MKRSGRGAGGPSATKRARTNRKGPTDVPCQTQIKKDIPAHGSSSWSWRRRHKQRDLEPRAAPAGSAGTQEEEKPWVSGSCEESPGDASTGSSRAAAKEGKAGGAKSSWAPRAFVEAHATASLLSWGLLEIASQFVDQDKTSLSFRHVFDPVVLSNIPLLPLALVYRRRGWILQATALAVSAAASLLYHSTVERDFLWYIN